MQALLVFFSHLPHAIVVFVVVLSISQDAVEMSCADDVQRKDLAGRVLPARQKSNLHAQTAARRVQFFSGVDINIDEINRK